MMNGKKRARGGEKEAAHAARAVPPPAASDGDAGATQPPAARKTPLPDAAAPPADGDEPPVEIVDNGGGGVEEEEEVDDEDDEQVERFYALLANIRAMRGLLPPPYASCAGGDDAGSRERLRAAEPPWRPAFRMEDFEVEAPAPSSKKTKLTTADGGESASRGARPAAVRSDSSGSYKD